MECQSSFPARRICQSYGLRLQRACYTCKHITSRPQNLCFSSYLRERHVLTDGQIAKLVNPLKQFRARQVHIVSADSHFVGLELRVLSLVDYLLWSLMKGWAGIQL